MSVSIFMSKMILLHPRGNEGFFYLITPLLYLEKLILLLDDWIVPANFRIGGWGLLFLEVALLRG